jgi:hypothetical protein
MGQDQPPAPSRSWVPHLVLGGGGVRGSALQRSDHICLFFTFIYILYELLGDKKIMLNFCGDE